MSDKNLKVFVTGASGLLGREIMKELLKLNLNTIGIAFSRVTENLTKCDLTKPGEVEELIRKFEPTFIIHAAAERFPDKVEKDFERTKLLNIDTSRRLAKVANEVGSRIIYISTDYVFDGSSPPYKEADKPNPLNKYGETKLEGEKAMVQQNPETVILRIPILYGPVEYLEESAVTTLLSCLLTTKEISVSHYEKRYPSHTRDIARVIVDLIRELQKDESLKGTFQWSGKETLTKYDMVRSISKALSLPFSHISPDSTPSLGARRPYDAHMDSSRLENLGVYHHTKFEDGVKECLESWVEKLTT